MPSVYFVLICDAVATTLATRSLPAVSCGKLDGSQFSFNNISHVLHHQNIQTKGMGWWGSAQCSLWWWPWWCRWWCMMTTTSILKHSHYKQPNRNCSHTEYCLSILVVVIMHHHRHHHGHHHNEHLALPHHPMPFVCVFWWCNTLEILLKLNWLPFSLPQLTAGRPRVASVVATASHIKTKKTKGMWWRGSVQCEWHDQLSISATR